MSIASMPRPRWRARGVVLLGALALFLGACGGTDHSAHDRATADSPGVEFEVDPSVRTIEIDMVDIEYRPGQVTVRAGEDVRFVFHNRGELLHDAFIGSAETQADHAAALAAGQHDAHDHGEAVTVEPGGSDELWFTFTDGDELVIGCHQPGHYDAGMSVELVVEPAGERA